MNNIPLIVSLIFGLTTLITAFFFYKAANHSKTVLIILFSWLLLQSIPGLWGFYTVTNGFPPRLVFAIVPPFVCIALLFLTKKGKYFIDHLDLKLLTLLHSVRILVELVLLCLYTYKTIPIIMTFEGRNFDILSGLTAPFIYYFGFVKKIINKKIILAWNLVCLVLLVNVVGTALLSAPFAFQQFAFDQPNIAILYFPFIWLPCCVVPLVLLSHLVAIRQLVLANKNHNGIL